MRLGPLNAQSRQVYFLDTPDLTLNKPAWCSGLAHTGQAADTAIKLRPAVPKDRPSCIRRAPGFTAEVDALRGGFVCSGALKQPTTNARVMDAVAGRLAPGKLFSKEQRAFHSQFAPSRLALPRRLKDPGTFNQVLASPGFQLAAETRGYLLQKGINPSGGQETKTKKAVEFFSASQDDPLPPSSIGTAA